ncbi:hypothetical protein B9Z19DRAFT_1078280 [Tuber borchii]|uniref:Uncharacterized protein n=1 Tax=Tuber borchii TaxID=42251 RepID=A0A2T6ZZT9_TUBBO|nr:hypothetical protein B9Z19DRAFT_1078280 [Tuber borchii]
MRVLTFFSSILSFSPPYLSFLPSFLPSFLLPSFLPDFPLFQPHFLIPPPSLPPFRPCRSRTFESCSMRQFLPEHNTTPQSESAGLDCTCGG